MKKVYETPVVDKVNFDYKNQVVASGSIVCYEKVTMSYSGCTENRGFANDQA